MTLYFIETANQDGGNANNWFDDDAGSFPHITAGTNMTFPSGGSSLTWW